LKLAFIAVGVVLMSRVRRKVFPREESLTGNAKGMAALSLLAWAGAITAGRLLAYTCTHLLGDIKC
jgi:hypothetical protein